MTEPRAFAEPFVGMTVEFRTGDELFAGTDDNLYVGVSGRGGGREFAVDVRLFDDHEQGSDVFYRFGEVWDAALLERRAILTAYEADGWNSPRRLPMLLSDVEQVYVRKAGTRQGDSDDAWMLTGACVTLYGDRRPALRRFESAGPIWLGNEFGEKLWLVEAPAPEA